MASHESKIQIFSIGPCLPHPPSLSHCVLYSFILASWPLHKPYKGLQSQGLCPCCCHCLECPPSWWCVIITQVLLKCHLLREAFPDHPHLKCPFYQSLSTTLLFSFFHKRIISSLKDDLVIYNYLIYLLNLCTVWLFPEYQLGQSRDFVSLLQSSRAVPST